MKEFWMLISGKPENIVSRLGIEPLAVAYSQQEIEDQLKNFGPGTYSICHVSIAAVAQGVAQTQFTVTRHAD